MSLEREARVLIVDDQREVARVLRTALELMNRDYFVVDVPSGEEALLELDHGSFDLIVSDYHLPGLSGLELIRRARKRHPETKVILITGHSLDDVQQEIETLNLFEIFAKPIDTDAFTEVVGIAIYGEHEVAEVETAAPEAVPIPDVDETPIRQQLTTLLIDLGARGIGFISRDGKILIKEGAVDDVPRFGELSVLLASNFTTTAEISTYLGDEPSTAVHYYDGSWYDVYALSVGINHFIAIVFPGGSQKQMGPVLRYAKPAVREIAGMIEQPAPEAEPVMEIEEREQSIRAEVSKEPAAIPAEAEEIEEALEEVDLEAALSLLKEGEEVDELVFDLDELELDLADDTEDVDGFWEEAGLIEAKISDDTLSMEEAVELGLIPKDQEIE